MAVTSHTPSRLAALPGVIFIVYALLCLALALWLGNRIAPVTDGAATAAAWVEPAPVDFKSISLHKARKQAFYDYFMPLIEHHNARALERRKQVLALQKALQEEGALSERQLQKLNRLAERYRIKRDIAPARQIELLLPKVDVIPPSMVLAQAAVESAWGTSRFAREANNFFGQWCYEPGCGLVPVKRRSGDNHEVARFESPSDAVDSYFRNINSHAAYAPVRAIRAQRRQTGGQLSGDHLIEGLHSYSTRRGGYIRELRTVMQGNNMSRFDQGLTTEF